MCSQLNCELSVDNIIAKVDQAMTEATNNEDQYVDTLEAHLGKDIDTIIHLMKVLYSCPCCMRHKQNVCKIDFHQCCNDCLKNINFGPIPQSIPENDNQLCVEVDRHGAVVPDDLDQWNVSQHNCQCGCRHSFRWCGRYLVHLKNTISG